MDWLPELMEETKQKQLNLEQNELVQTLKEIIRVKFKDGDDTFYKRYPASEVKIIKNIGREEIDPEEKEHAKELAELEKLEKLDEQTKSDNDI